MRRPASKLTAAQVRGMRQRYLNGWTQSRLANEYQVSIGHVGLILRGSVWQTAESGWTPPEAEASEGHNSTDKLNEGK